MPTEEATPENAETTNTPSTGSCNNAEPNNTDQSSQVPPFSERRSSSSSLKVTFLRLLASATRSQSNVVVEHGTAAEGVNHRKRLPIDLNATGRFNVVPGAVRMHGPEPNSPHYDIDEETQQHDLYEMPGESQSLTVEAHLVPDNHDIVVAAQVVALERNWSIPARSVMWGSLIVLVMVAVAVGVSIGVLYSANTTSPSTPLESYIQNAIKLGGTITNLVSSSVSSSKLIGPIPTEIGLLTLLTNLELNSNSLTGTIPTELRSLTRLTLLYLFDNQLTGSIPTEIGSLTSLIFFSLSGNKLRGPIPAEIGSLSSLKYLTLNTNMLTGSIPFTIGSLSSLGYLDLFRNQLNGTIPSSMALLTGLSNLNLNSNVLMMTIPTEIGALTGLTNLDLSNNSLTGPIPTAIGSLTSLTFLSLRTNALTGSVPKELGRLSNLKSIYIETNNLKQTTDLIFCTDHLNFTTLYADCSNVNCTCCTHCF